MSSLFGGGSPPQINYRPQGFSGGGLNFNNGTLTENPQLSSQIGGLQQTFTKASNAYGNLAQSVQPGFSTLRQAGLRQLSNQQFAARANLRDTLAQRRILGSSFANSSISQQEAEFGQQKADFAAQSYLQELQASQQLIQQQYQAATQSFSVGINQMNFEAGIAANLTTSNNQINANIAKANADLQWQSQQANAAGIGKLIGTAISVGAAPFTGGASLAALPGIWAGGGGGGGGGGGFGSGFTFSNPFASTAPTVADFGGPGIGSGGYNFIDASSGT